MSEKSVLIFAGKGSDLAIFKALFSSPLSTIFFGDFHYIRNLKLILNLYYTTGTLLSSAIFHLGGKN